MTGGRSTRFGTMLDDQRVRFVLVGGVNTVVGYGLFSLTQFLIGGVISYFGSLLIAHLIASVLAFVLYRRWVFRVEGTVVVDFLRFQVVYLIPLAANLLALPLLVAVAGWNVYLAQAVIVVMSTIVSFVGHKFFSFRRPGVPVDSEVAR
ncbi:MAG: GtrA family protein [Pseudolysinimonas sp.]